MIIVNFIIFYSHGANWLTIFAPKLQQTVISLKNWFTFIPYLT